MSFIVATIVVGIGALTAMVGAIFTDSQWADVQSALNFIVLAYVAHQQRAIKKSAPTDAAEQTVDRLVHEEDVKVAMAEVLADAMARRRRKVGY